MLHASGHEKCFWVLVGKRKEGVHLEDLSVDGSIMLKWALEMDVDWINVAQDMVKFYILLIR
jgi:hypothetical protein